MLHSAFQLKIKSLHQVLAERQASEGCEYILYFKKNKPSQIELGLFLTEALWEAGLQIPFQPQAVLCKQGSSREFP